MVNYWSIFKQSVKKFFADDPMSYSASIAFYTIFSLPAIFVITVSIAASAYEDEVVRNTIIEQIQRLIGSGNAATAKSLLANASGIGSSPIAQIIGIITLIFSATTVFVSLQNGINNIWGIEAKPGLGVWHFIANRLLSLAMVVSIGFLLLVSLVFDTVLVIFNDTLSQLFSGITVIFVGIVNLAFSICVITLVFALIYKILPDAHIQWRDVWTGAFFTTILFTIGKYVIGFYLSTSSIGDAYGAAGSLVLLLIWVYYSSVIVLFGAEFTYVYSKAIGHRIKVEKHAVAIRENEKKDEVVN